MGDESTPQEFIYIEKNDINYHDIYLDVMMITPHTKYIQTTKTASRESGENGEEDVWEVNQCGSWFRPGHRV